MIAILLGLACSTAPGIEKEAVSDTAGPLAPITAVLDGACTLDPDHQLRAVCSALVEPPTDVIATLTAGNQAVGLTVPADQATAFTVPFLRTDTAWNWRLARADDTRIGRSGTLTTGSVPDAVRPKVSVSGVLSTGPVGFRSPCPGDTRVWAIDQDGAIIGFQDLAAGLDPAPVKIEAVSWTEDETWLAILDNDVVVEWTATGDRRLLNTTGWAGTLHHDITRRDGRTWVLFTTPSEEEPSFLRDGFHVLDSEGAIEATWFLTDHLTPLPGTSSGPAPEDWSHANALWVDSDGLGLLSLRHLSAILGVVVDPDRPDFGAVQWSLVGDPESPLMGEVPLTSSVPGATTFVRQHDPRVVADGTLLLFDNRLEPTESSRVLRLATDLPSEATIIDAWQLDEHCRFQGGAWLTNDGHPVATCAPSATATELDAASGAWRGTISVECQTGPSTFVPRFLRL